MADETPEKPNEQPSEGDKLFGELSEEVDRLEPEMEEDEGEGGEKSLKDKLSETPNLTDTQAILDRLSPKGLGDSSTNHLQEGRVDPGCFMSLLRILVKRECLRADPNKPLDVGAAVAKVYTLLTIGLDGKGRIDLLELAGAASDKEMIEKTGGLLS